MPIIDSVKVNNQIEIRMIYVDTKEEIVFKSMAYAARTTGITAKVIKDSLNPLNKRKHNYNDRVVVFRLKK